MGFEAIADQLISLTRTLSEQDHANRPKPIGKITWRELPEIYPVQSDLNSRARELVQQLNEALTDANWNPKQPINEAFSDEEWTFGTAETIRAPIREIHGGFLEPTRRVPLVAQLPQQVVYFLITIEEGSDYLERETHGMGWHYHYLDWKERRSNVVLSWDTRWTNLVPQTKPPQTRGLFVEEHGEKTNADFTAKPWLWGLNKRKTMYEACSPDLVTWPIESFKCAANKSEVVYPLTSSLTPHPSSVTGLSTGAVRSKAKRRRY
ncbi:hypothetical protein [Mesorhizobium sp. L-2-11]|uniref:hypothetical protein n=1 Tax=Mesorhizobium sp. L-2-11 TaxID=2744521 RepID=UPI001927F9D4|nr:hypothetical protein [Mesorhizobium sp. L-2-11]BCH19596.1 hypothetical protein MesoLjLa_64470 [Mesorhizobium sp. L-2-11]